MSPKVLPVFPFPMFCLGVLAMLEEQKYSLNQPLQNSPLYFIVLFWDAWKEAQEQF